MSNIADEIIFIRKENSKNDISLYVSQIISMKKLYKRISRIKSHYLAPQTMRIIKYKK